MTQSRKIHVGTSGWHYAHWRGPFYPPSVRNAEMLAYYAERFDIVQLNNTFYRLPTERAVIDWRESSPPGFEFGETTFYCRREGGCTKVVLNPN